jgi:filamentous hemagglutinin
MSGSAGQQLEINAFYPFGRTQTASPQANFKVSNQFTGQVKDEETGLYYYGARYYDPELGRFIQADTIIPDLDNPQSYNRYAYTLNNPLRYTDPTGHEPDDDDFDVPMTMGAAHAAMRQSAGGESARLYDKSGAELKATAAIGRAAAETFPPVGGFNSAYQVTTGKDAIDAHKLTTKERALSGFDVGLQGAGKVVKAGAAVGAVVVTSKMLEGASDVNKVKKAANLADSVADAARLKTQLAAQEIAGGHAFAKHVIKEGQFPGITTPQQFAAHIEKIIDKPSAVKNLSNGRTAYWDSASATVVIRNPKAVDGGTAFKPTDGVKYFENLK